VIITNRSACHWLVVASGRLCYRSRRATVALAGRGERASLLPEPPGGRYGTVKSAATQSSAAGTTVEGGEERSEERIIEKIKERSPIVAKVISQKYTKKVMRVELSWTMLSRAVQAKLQDPALRMPGLFPR